MPFVLLLFFDILRIEHVFNPSHWDICSVNLRIEFSLRNKYVLFRCVLNYFRLVKYNFLNLCSVRNPTTQFGTL